MAKTVELQIPINRVEGDLDIKVTIKDGVIVEAKSIGTLYRGFENILRGRDPLDALVITPRVCGICSISHLSAAVKALEDAYDITPPPQAVRFRNLSIICENAQSDLKQFFLMFMADFAHEYYQDKSFFDIAKKSYAPFKGKMANSVLDITKDLLKVIAYIGGQWPHTSHMVPGGLSVISDDLEIFRIRLLVKKFRIWYEEEVLKTTVKEFKNITDFEKFEEFCNSNKSSHISLFYEIAKETNLLNIGKTGYGFINYGSIDKVEDDKVVTVVPKCVIENREKKPLDIAKITEDVTYSWYEDDETTSMFKSKTIPNIDKKGGYSFTKAPRYDEKVFQTGPLGEELALENPLFKDLYEKFEDCVFVRELARLLRVLRYIEVLESQTEEIIQNIKEPIYVKPEIKKEAKGVGLTHAARGALGHWIKIKDGKIKNYQIISPTTWNGSPMDKLKNYGPWEKALLGLEIKNIENPMEMGHVIRSFDPCLVCTVHFIGDKNSKITLRA